MFLKNPRKLLSAWASERRMRGIKVSRVTLGEVQQLPLYYSPIPSSGFSFSEFEPPAFDPPALPPYINPDIVVEVLW